MSIASYQSQKWQRERESRSAGRTRREKWYWIKIIGNQSGDIELSKEQSSDYDHSLTNDYNINTGPPEICRLIYSGRRAGTQSVSCRYHQLACQDWFERLIFCSSSSSRYNGHWCPRPKRRAARWSRTPPLISLLQVAPFFSIFQIAAPTDANLDASTQRKTENGARGHILDALALCLFLLVATRKIQKQPTWCRDQALILILYCVRKCFSPFIS